MELPRLSRIIQAAAGEAPDGAQQPNRIPNDALMSGLPRPNLVEGLDELPYAQALASELIGDHLCRKLDLQAGEIEQGMPFARRGEVDQPHEVPRADQDILQIEIAVDYRGRALHPCGEEVLVALERVGER